MIKKTIQTISEKIKIFYHIGGRHHLHCRRVLDGQELGKRKNLYSSKGHLKEKMAFVVFTTKSTAANIQSQQ